jgi:UTP:GlnB (protein PII) uridylyltransferase
MLKISDIKAGKIRNSGLMEELPEFYELKAVMENNAWHNRDSTFNHTLTVMEELEKLLNKTGSRVKRHLAEKIGCHTRRELLILAALLHDIAKKEALKAEGKNTYFPGHEEASALKAGKILSRFDISPDEKEFVTDIIRNHNAIHLLLDSDDGGAEERVERCRKAHSGIFTELVLLSIADTLGSQLRENAPKNFRFRMRVLRDALDRC